MAQVIQIPFRAGVDEGSDPKQLPPGTLTAGRNVRQDKLGRIRKRHGTNQALPMTTTDATVAAITTPARGVELGDGGLGCIDGKFLWTYIASLGKWSMTDRVPNLNVVQRPLVDDVTGATCVDVALYNTWLVSVWRVGLGDSAANTAAYVQVHDTATWDLVLPPLKVTTGDASLRVRIVVNGTHAAIFTGQGTTVVGRLLDLTTLGLSGAVTMFSGLASAMFDVGVAGGMYYMIANLSAGVNRVRVEAFDTSLLSVLGPTDLGGATTVSALGLWITGSDDCYVSWALSGGSWVAILHNATLALTMGPSSFAAATSPSQVFAFHDGATAGVIVGHASGSTLLTKRLDGSLVAIANTDRTTKDVGCVARPWQQNGRWYTTALVRADNKDFRMSPYSRVVLEILFDAFVDGLNTVPPHRQVATLENETGWYWLALEQDHMPTVPVDASGNAYAVSTFRHSESLSDKEIATGVHVNVLSETGDRFRMLRAGNTHLLVGGAPSRWDGLTVAPYGFTHAPEISVATPGAGGSMAAGSYQYAAVFVRVGADGIEQRSPPSNIVTVNVAASGSVALTFVAASLSGKLSEKTGFSNAPCRTFVKIYRTECNGEALYELSVDPAVNLVLNDPTAATVTFTDTRADSDIANTPSSPIALSTRDQLYTNSELDDVPPPASTTGTVHGNRFWLLASDEVTLWASKDASEDLTVAPGFNEELTLAFASRKKALASLDDKLVVLGETSIDAVFGRGPASDGSANDWQIAAVHTEIGCTEPRSVAVIPPGIVFRSSRGWELLDRGLVVTYIGAGIEDTTALYPTVTSAVVVPDEHEVRFTCNDAPGVTGIVLVFNYRFRAWYTRSYPQNLPFADAVLVDGVYTMLHSSGVVVQETTTSALDNGAYVEMRASVPVYPPGAAAWHRLKAVQIVGESKSNHQLNVEITRDFAADPEQTKSFEPSAGVTTVGPLEQCRVTLKNQKRQAAQITIYDAAPTDTVTYPVGTGEGPILEILALHVQPKSGPAKLPAAKRG